MKSLVPFLFVISSLVHSGVTQHCYHCDSTSNHACGDNPKFDASQAENLVADCPTVLGQHQSGANAGAGSSSGYGGQGGQAGAGSGSGAKGNKQLCYKATVKDDHSGDYIVFRGCSPHATEKQTCDALKSDQNILPHGSTMYSCKTCVGDICNSARHLSVTFTLLLLPAFVFIKNYV